VNVSSSEEATVINRPLLQVSYTVSATSPPDAPTNLVASATVGNQIQLNWTDNSNIESGFEIERSTDGAGGPFTLLVTVGTNVNSYLDAGLDNNTEYCYRVRAYNSLGNSDYSNTDCATTPANPNNALDFGGTNAYVKVNDLGSLGLYKFTVETWFKKEGTGVYSSTTGTDGLDNVIPLVTKGSAETEDSTKDINYFLCITSDNFLAADL